MRRYLPMAFLGIVAISFPEIAPAEDPTKVTPGHTVASKPDKDGIVTVLRPVVTRLSSDDPVRIALHWAAEKGPISERTAGMRKMHRSETLRSMTFVLTLPDGKKQEFKADVQGQPGEWVPGIYYAPTYLLALSKDHLGFDEGHRGPQPSKKAAWVVGKSPDLSKPGVYKLKITGQLVSGKEGTPFESGEITFEVGVATIKSQAEIEKTAREALSKRVANLPPKVDYFLTENGDGDRLVRFRTAGGKKWGYMEHTVEVKPDGTVGKISDREVFTCVARGTVIDAEVGPRAIETIREGDRVWGYDGKQRVLTTVRVVRRSAADRTLVFGDGLRVTAEHPLWASGEWRAAGQIGPRERLLDAQLCQVEAGAPRVIDDPIDVYDLTVDGPHCFFAGGLLVHNKDRAYSPNLDDPWYSLGLDVVPPAK
jgi:hypothetical protein